MAAVTAPLERFVSFHAFSGDGSECAISKNDDAVYIYKTNGKKETPSAWTETQVVTEHGGHVSGIDWCASSNLIVTCGHDRNAYVWKYEDAEKAWKPTLVILRINRAATCVRWSPRGDKFAVGSGAKCVPVCHFEEAQNWWISKMIKKHKSSVLDLAWSPNQKFLVTGASDFKCRIFSAFIDGIDSQEDDGASDFGKNTYVFGEALYEFDMAKAWVQGVAWSPCGLKVAYAGHGSTLTFVTLAPGGTPSEQNLHLKGLPYNLCHFTSPDTLIAVGFEFNPHVYTLKGDAWERTGELDDGVKAAAGPKASSASAARNMFQDRDNRGKTGGGSAAKEEPELNTIHKNVILDMKLFDGGFTTSGVDGRIVTWKA